MEAMVFHGRCRGLLLLCFLFPLSCCFYFCLSSGDNNFPIFAPTCSVTNNYTDGSTYEGNLGDLLERLPRNALSNGSFSMDTVGSPADQQVFGLAMCYADWDIFDCKTCLDQAATPAVPFCPHSTDVAACFDGCVVRYASTSFFSEATLTWEFEEWTSKHNVSDDDAGTLATVRTQLMYELIDGISAPLLISSGQRSFNDTQTMYGLVQCTRDLPVAECQRCLKAFVPELSEDFQLSWYGKLYGYSCYMRYDLDRFDVNMPPPPSSIHELIVKLVVGKLTDAEAGGSKKIAVATIAGIVAGGSAVVLLVVAVVVVVMVRRRGGSSTRLAPKAPGSSGSTTHSEPPSATTTTTSPLVPRKFTLPELEAATNNFAREVGRGAYGNVYRGELPDGQVIAVKELKMGDRLNGFEKETQILGALRHRNIVGLVGYCHEGGKYMLCFEFVPDGNLQEHLFGDKAKLDWPTRFNIIKGVCRGLIYLHEDSRRCTVHLDLKPSNILLHKNHRGQMEPKISDFGISRLLEQDNVDYHQTIHTIAGSSGYIAPEYLNNGIVSTKADVYSFGIVILEMVTGLRNRTFSRGDLADEFIEYVRRQWDIGNGNINEIRDSSMGDIYSVPEIRQCIEIALQCIQRDPSGRPDAKTIYYRMFDDGNA
ncbi:hypothetical protein U9M48_001223 [Paspalum notatum var. saurae]|uniref:Uncharacterized protein n=1 Tax=Paspalum notatum var. saurae TaxID=547442 RepID=A0AAQ3PFM8_PASNO